MKRVCSRRQVEGPAVEGDHAGKLGNALGNVCHHRPLFAERAHEVLLDDEPLTLKEAQPDEEGIGTGAAGQPGGLSVQEHCAVWLKGGQRRIGGQERQAGRAHLGEGPQHLATVLAARQPDVAGAEEAPLCRGHLLAGDGRVEGQRRAARRRGRSLTARPRCA